MKCLGYKGTKIFIVLLLTIFMFINLGAINAQSLQHNENIEKSDFTGQSLGLGLYNINHQFENIAGVKLNNNASMFLVADNDFIYYLNATDGRKIYRINKENNSDTTFFSTGIDSSSYNPLVLDDNNIYYSFGSKIYKIGKNGVGNIKLTDNHTRGFILDNDYIYYNNNTLGGLYKISKNGTGDMKLSSLTPSSLIADNNHIYYNNNGLYKIGKDGTGNIKLSNNISYDIIVDDNYIYYSNSSDGGKIYRIGKDGTGDIKLTNNRANGLRGHDNYIYYSNSSDGGKIYRIGKDGTGDIKINDIISGNIIVDDNFIYYSNSSDGGKIYKINKNNPEGYSLDDGTYKSTKLLPGKVLTNLKVNIDSVIPSGTNYSFSLANENLEQTLIESNESGIYIMWPELNLISNNYVNGTMEEILSKVNIGDTIYFEKNGNVLDSKVSYKKDYRIGLEYKPNVGNLYGSRIYIGGPNFVKIDNTNLDGNTNLNLNNIFGFSTDKLYYKIELIGDQNDTTKTPIINSVELIESKLDTPTNLKQYIKLPEAPSLEKQEIPLATKVGKYQSGSGVILSAYVENSTSTQLRLEFEVYRLGAPMPSIQLNTNYFSSGTGEVVIPYLGVGQYYWKVRTKDINGLTSDWGDYNTNYPWEYDYTLFEGFEPYPYGYRFENSSPANGFLSKILNGRVTYGTRNDGLIGRIKVPGNKWDIFESAFDTSMYHTFSNDTKLFDAFEFYGLNSDNAFQGGSCYGMALSSAMQFSHSGFLSESFSNNVGTGMIWNKINRLETKFEDGKYKWSKYDDTLKTIFALQLSQFSSHQNAKRLDYDTPINIFNTLNNNPDKIYLLNFWWEQPKLLYGTGYYGHAVIPYRVEIRNDSRRIYFWDNNVPYDGTSQNLAYEQYIDINFDGTVTSSRYNFAPFRDISLVNIDDLYNNGNKSFPGGFAGLDLAFSLSGNSDLYVEDNLGRKSGFLQGNIYEEIPGVNVIIPYNTGEEENTWKQIYLPEKQNLTVKVVGKSQENYDLMIAGGDYYTKLEGVKTSMGELDSFISTRENVKIDFDNSKTGTYNLLVDNFYNNGTGSIFMQDMPIIGNKISYNINWSKVLNNSNDAVIYGLDINNDGTNDYEQELPPLYQYSIATLMSKPTSMEDYDNSEGK